MFPRLKLITFDLDDTLWPCMPVIINAEEQTHHWLAQHAPLAAQSYSVTAMREHRIQTSQQYPQHAHNLTLTRQLSLQSILEQFGYDAEIAIAAVDVFMHHRNQVTPFDDVIPVLDELRKHAMLIALSNGNADVEQTPLAGKFHYSLNAETVGAKKPDPAMFQQAMLLAKATPEQSLHIGDDTETDIAAAKQLGMHTLHIDRYHDNSSSLSDISTLPELLAR